MADVKTYNPVHPALTHFPVALWISAVILDFVSFGYGNSFVRAAYYMVLLGGLWGIVTAFAGLYDYTKIHAGTEAKKLGLTHAFLMVVTTIFFLANAWVRSFQLRADHTPGIALGMALVGIVAVCVGGWLGHRLVFHYGANVMAPQKDRTDFRLPTRPQIPVQP